MFDLLPSAIQGSIDAVKWFAAGSGSTILLAYVYAKRATIAGWFKRAEATASFEVAGVRQALVNLENEARKGFGIVGNATREVQTAVVDIKGRLEKIETAVFGAPVTQPPANPGAEVQVPSAQAPAA